MKIDAGVILTWVLFLALFPMVFVWLRRAYRIFFLIKITPKLHLSVENHLRILKNGLHSQGLLTSLQADCFWTIIGVVVLGYEYSKWSAMAGCTIWGGKIFADWILRNQAHPFQFGKKKKTAVAN